MRDWTRRSPPLSDARSSGYISHLVPVRERGCFIRLFTHQCEPGGKEDRSLLPACASTADRSERPVGRFAQKTPVPFLAASVKHLSAAHERFLHRHLTSWCRGRAGNGRSAEAHSPSNATQQARVHSVTLDRLVCGHYNSEPIQVRNYLSLRGGCFLRHSCLPSAAERVCSGRRQT